MGMLCVCSFLGEENNESRYGIDWNRDELHPGLRVKSRPIVAAISAQEKDPVYFSTD